MKETQRTSSFQAIYRAAQPVFSGSPRRQPKPGKTAKELIAIRFCQLCPATVSSCGLPTVSRGRYLGNKRAC